MTSRCPRSSAIALLKWVGCMLTFYFSMQDLLRKFQSNNKQERVSDESHSDRCGCSRHRHSGPVVYVRLDTLFRPGTFTLIVRSLGFGDRSNRICESSYYSNFALSTSPHIYRPVWLDRCMLRHSCDHIWLVRNPSTCESGLPNSRVLDIVSGNIDRNPPCLYFHASGDPVCSSLRRSNWIKHAGCHCSPRPAVCVCSDAFLRAVVAPARLEWTAAV